MSDLKDFGEEKIKDRDIPKITKLIDLLIEDVDVEDMDEMIKMYENIAYNANIFVKELRKLYGRS